MWTQHEKRLPKPRKVAFRLHETHGFKNYSESSTRLKGHQNEVRAEPQGVPLRSEFGPWKKKRRSERGQIQSRSSEKDYFSILSDPETEKAVMIERAVLTAFGGGCQVALGAHYQKDEDVLHFFHESCGIRSMKIHGRPQSIWLKDLLQWTRCK